MKRHKARCAHGAPWFAVCAECGPWAEAQRVDTARPLVLTKAALSAWWPQPWNLSAEEFAIACDPVTKEPKP